MQAEIDQLRAIVEALQAEVAELKANDQPPATTASQAPVVTPSAPAFTPPPKPASVPVASPVASPSAPPAGPPAATSPASAIAQESAGTVPGQSDDTSPTVRQSISGNPAGVSRIDNEAPPTNPGLTGFFRVPGTLTWLRLGGYTKLDAIYDTSEVGNDEQWVVPSIPVPSTPYDSGHFNLHARQTRFSLEARHPTIFGQSMRFYVEGDFYGGSGGQYQFRLRHAFGQLGNTYAGFGYSVFMDVDALPDTLDFAGPGAAVSVRQPNIHQAFHLGDTGSLTVSVERPSSEVSTIVPGAAIQGTEHVPDLAIAARADGDGGHLQLGGLLRQVGFDDGVRTDDSMAGGVALSGAWSLAPGTTRSDLLLFSGVWGKGVARYLSELSGSNLDAVVDVDGQVHPLEAWGGYAAYTHYWNDDWRSSLVYGQTHLEASPWLADTAFGQTTYGALNLIWSPVDTLTLGMELLYGRYELQNGLSNDSARLQGSLKYDFIR